jgi:NAD(P)-dependent dehydrogenase (short-subunit alcohol dehydrogenase family)
MADLFDLSGKVALVTGGSRGLGRAMAIGLAEHGADVLVTSRKAGDCAKVAEEIEALGRRALAYACHIGQWDALPGLVAATYEAFGKVDILVNNAGIAPVAPSSLELSEELFDKTVGVNFKGPFRLSALVASRMVDAGSGTIINISSNAAVRPVPAYPVYAAAKAALNTITRAHAFEYGPQVRVNTIMCGPFWTDISKTWRERADRDSAAALNRIGRPHEIVTTALYLASDQSSFTTGATIELDGGLP